MRILIADDDFTSRTLLAGVLKKKGHDVVETVDGEKAWEVLQHPDAPLLVILDWMMPEMDGLEVIRRIRAQPAGRLRYILLLTAKGTKADFISGLTAGADDYLSKPFDSGELCARINVGQRMLTIQASLSSKIEELRQALDHVKTLRGIVPICASCKKIRDDRGYWSQVEIYVRDHSEAQFSHGICPECEKKAYDQVLT